MLSYYRNFIPHFTEKSTLLRNLLTKDAKLCWTSEHEQELSYLKDALVKYTELQLPMLDKDFTLQTDASDYGIGAVLMQEGENNELKPICFISRALTASERNYTTTEKELLAVIHALQKFQAYLEFAKVTIYTDHKAITFIKGLKIRLDDSHDGRYN